MPRIEPAALLALCTRLKTIHMPLHQPLHPQIHFVAVAFNCTFATLSMPLAYYIRIPRWERLPHARSLVAITPQGAAALPAWFYCFQIRMHIWRITCLPICEAVKLHVPDQLSL